MLGLTLREQQIIGLVSHGNTAKEVARILDLGYRTVEKYALSARKKLKARNIAHAVFLASQLGMSGEHYT